MHRLYYIFNLKIGWFEVSFDMGIQCEERPRSRLSGTAAESGFVSGHYELHSWIGQEPSKRTQVLCRVSTTSILEVEAWNSITATKLQCEFLNLLRVGYSINFAI